MAAYRLVSARGLDGNVRRVDTPDRRPRRRARRARSASIARCASTRAARLVTVVGDAGVGKSRLVHELLERVAVGARVLRGRCLPYGEGITFWPLRRDGARRRPASATRIRRTPRATSCSRVIGEQDVADRLACAIGLCVTPYPLHELYWAARKFLEVLAANAPVVALVDDIHWAEPAFLDLLEHVLDTSTGAPILLLATARHDLLEERPQWGERAGATRLVLAR